MATFSPQETALILIDLQKGIASRPELQPHSGDEVVARSKALAEKFRAAGALVVQVNVGWSADLADMPSQEVDEPMGLKPGALPPEWLEFVEGLKQPGDLVVTKRQWGAFHGTELDLQLRRRGIRRVVVGGIATNIGVESSVRAAWEHGYHVVVAEDLCATMSAEMHAFAFEKIFPRCARVLQSADIALS